MCVSLDEPELVDSILTFLSGYDTLEYSWVKATVVSMRLRILFVTLQNTNKLSGAVDSVILVSFYFFFFDSTSTPATHGAAIPFTALFTQERVLRASTLC